jgi:hypothetical protein
MVTSRAAYSAALAAVCLAVLATRVPLEFERVRFRIITTPTPALGQSLTVSLPELSQLAGSPAAVIMRLRGGSQPIGITLALNGAAISNVVVPPNRDIRLDASIDPPAGSGHRLFVTGNAEGWQVTYLEIANVHGFSRGLLGFDIVPRERTDFRRAPWWILVLLAAGLLALGRQPNWPPGATWRRAYRAGLAVVLLLFFTVVLADRFTQFKILLSLQIFLLCVAVLYAQRTAQACRPLWRLAIAFFWRPPAIWRTTARAVGSFAATPWVPAALAGGAAISASVMALALGAHYAGGADSYGYVAQAELWARGQLYVDQPIVSELPPGMSEGVVTPLGFVTQPHSGVRGRIVPTYSPGLPMFMGVLRRVLGPSAVYLVVPALAGVTIWLTFVLGRELNGGATGLFAALWLTASPAFLQSSLNPLSDVPVTAWWLLALLASYRPSLRSAAIAGTAVSLAVLTRPNLAPLAIVVGLPILGRWWFQARARVRGVELGVFLGTAAVGPLIIAALYNYWYGSPFTSGYGPTNSMFSWSFVGPNLARYPRWFAGTETLLTVGCLAAPFLLRGREGVRSRLRPAAAAWLLLAFSLLVWGAYIAYYYFDAWWYLRFLLPSYPPIIALASAALVFALRRTAAPRTLGAVLLVLLAMHGLQFCWKQYVFSIGRGEARYRRTGEFVSSALPDRSLLLSMQHSGSLRYYSHLATLRYDVMPPDRLDDVVAYFEARGRSVFIVLDEWEKQDFRGRFARDSALGALDWTPFAVAPGGMPVTIYDPRDRMSTSPVATRIIP